ncbi:MAG: NAD(P)/FAD-dependent oxidoreductase, partial [Pseudomonadota bacterium]
DLSHTAQVATDDRPIAALRDAGGDITVEFKDGGSATFAAVFTAPSVSLDDTPAAMLGCAMADGPLGAFVQVGPMGQTSVPHVFAAGDCASPAHSVTPALGAGAMAGIGCHQSLLFPSMIQPFEVVHHD